LHCAEASEVEGDSKEVDATVAYEGREMVVSKGFDRNGALKMINMNDATIVQLKQAAHVGLTLKFF
jgi:DNA uptake protein ComE-like DNA-binding protein